MDLSVVIPTYNRVTLLPKVIDAWRDVHRVTKCRYEIIFSDDGSQDGTVEFLRQVRDLPLTTLENEHGGPSKARNIAIMKARGKRLLIMGDDIFPSPEVVNRHWEVSKRLGKSVAVLGQVEWHRQLKVNHLMLHITEIGNEQFSYNRLTPDAFTDFRHFYTCNISIDREALAEEPIVFDERFYKVNFEDIELGYRLSKRGVKFFFSPAAVGYHYHPYTVKEFYKRQENAGEMAVVFCRLHPEVNEVIRVSAIKEGYSSYRACRGERSEQRCKDKVLDEVITRCEEYEAILEAEREVCAWDRMLLKNNLSNIYSRLFRLSYESGILAKLFPEQKLTIEAYLQERYFGWDFYWETKTSLLCMWRHYGHFGKKHLLTLGKEYLFASRREIKDKWLHLLLWIVREGKRVVKGLIRRSRFLQTIRDSVLMYRLKRRLRNSHGFCDPARLGIILPDWEGAAKELASRLRSDFGGKISLICSSKDGYILGCSNGEVRKYLTRQDLPADYIYEPQNVHTTLSIEHLKNVMLCLNFYAYDFVLVSHTLFDLPQVAIATLKNQVIYSIHASKFPDIEHGLGKVLRLIPGSSVSLEQTLESVFPGRKLFFSCDAGIVCIGKKTERPCLQRRAPFMTFLKSKTTIFVWPIFMAVGGVERNTIEIMRQLSSDYHFVLITMERLQSSQGSLHHQLKDITTDVYDLAEIAPQTDFLSLLAQLKQIYDPNLIWICNGSPWLADNALSIREMFQSIPIVDQQVYDTKEGWINRYQEKGIRSFDRFIAINRKIEQVFYERIGIEKDKVDLINSAINTRRITLSKQAAHDESALRQKHGIPLHKRYFVSIGRLHPQKQPLDFLKLAERMQQKDNSALFVMVGDGPLRNEVDEFIAQHQLENVLRIDFVENTVELLLFSSGIIVTSAYEGLPVALLEALAVEVPAFCTDVGDIRAVLEEFGGGITVACSGDINEYEQKFNEFLCNLKEYRRNLESNATRILERFSEENTARRYASVFERAMNEIRKVRRI